MNDLKTLQAEGLIGEITTELVNTREAAERLGFTGSPTVIVDGEDPFATPGAPIGLACRVYRSESGFTGTPPMADLRTAIESRSKP